MSGVRIHLKMNSQHRKSVCLRCFDLPCFHSIREKAERKLAVCFGSQKAAKWMA